MRPYRAILLWICRCLPAAAATVAMLAVLSGCQKPPEPPAKARPLPVNAAPAKSAPLRPGPGETASSSLAKKDDAPPYVKIKRDKDGRYTWDISGKNVDQIIRTDRQLRRSLGEGKAEKAEKAGKE